MDINKGGSMNKEKFEQLAKEIYGNAVKKGFHDKKRSWEKAMMLIIGEVNELHDAYRDGKLFSQCDKAVTDFTYFEEESADIAIRVMDTMMEYNVDLGIIYDNFELFISEYDKGHIEIPLKKDDVSEYCYELISLLSSDMGINNLFALVLAITNVVSATSDYNLWDSIERKMAYNATRERLHGKKF